MHDDLARAVEASDVDTANNVLKVLLSQQDRPWDLHLALFPAVQLVLNPPFINPHLPKMYGVCREFLPYLEKDDLPSLVRLEVTEYTRRPKLARLSPERTARPPVTFDAVESAIRRRDWKESTSLMKAFYEREGGKEFARRLLLLGSGYLHESVGHSISCTTFILLEMMERRDQDPWPALSLLADYFCKGGFHTTPSLRETAQLKDSPQGQSLLQAASGRGFTNLHHTITRYAIERARGFFTDAEYQHLIAAWIDFMGEKPAHAIALGETWAEAPHDYDTFYACFSRLDANAAIAALSGMVTTPQGRRQAGRFLVKGLCDLYQGHYNPHYLTGLGSALWILEGYQVHPQAALNALLQYIDFFFQGLKE